MFAYGKKFYEGGFEEDMDRREAAKILGCRESSTRERIMARYRTLMKKNHPDLGGSPFLSTKINEAKELLHKTARSEDRQQSRSRH
jgi:DnaJ-class molecular chaperone